MGKQDVNMIHSLLECNQVLCNGKPQPRPRLRRERKSSRSELQIKGSVWTDISPELKTTWAQEDDKNKEHIITEFKVSVTKNRQLTAYQVTSCLQDGYGSVFTANT